jgi:hypothetical protein
MDQPLVYIAKLPEPHQGIAVAVLDGPEYAPAMVPQMRAAMWAAGDDNPVKTADAPKIADLVRPFMPGYRAPLFGRRRSLNHVSLLARLAVPRAVRSVTALPVAGLSNAHLILPQRTQEA